MSRSCNCDKLTFMVDLTEIEALKASMRGARSAADADLDDLQRLTLANAIAAQALRGLVETMLKRRGKLAAAVAETGNAGVEE
jgi:hypothetical protein